MSMTPCAVRYPYLRREPGTRVTILIIIVIIMAITAIEGWPLGDVITLVTAAAVVSGVDTVPRRVTAGEAR